MGNHIQWCTKHKLPTRWPRLSKDEEDAIMALKKSMPEWMESLQLVASRMRFQIVNNNVGRAMTLYSLQFCHMINQWKWIVVLFLQSINRLARTRTVIISVISINPKSILKRHRLSQENPGRTAVVEPWWCFRFTMEPKKDCDPCYRKNQEISYVWLVLRRKFNFPDSSCNHLFEYRVNEFQVNHAVRVQREQANRIV